MRVYRIAKERYIHDLTGDGARRYGGRWNRKGTPVLYTSESRALATVEYLVHLPMSIVPADMVIAEIAVPDTIDDDQINPDDLPVSWADSPAPMALAELGEEWIKAGKTLLLRAPSAVVKGEWNRLINPQHRLIERVHIVSVEPYQFDDRLITSR